MTNELLLMTKIGSHSVRFSLKEMQKSVTWANTYLQNEILLISLASSGKQLTKLSISLFCLETNVKSEMLSLIIISPAIHQSSILFRWMILRFKSIGLRGWDMILSIIGRMLSKRRKCFISYHCFTKKKVSCRFRHKSVVHKVFSFGISFLTFFFIVGGRIHFIRP